MDHLKPIGPPEDLSHLNPRHGQRIAQKLSAAAAARPEHERQRISKMKSAAGKAKHGGKQHRWGG